jgi:hypothetical protein
MKTIANFVLLVLIAGKTASAAAQSSRWTHTGLAPIAAERVAPFMGEFEFVGPESSIAPSQPLPPDVSAMALVRLDEKNRIVLSVNFLRQLSDGGVAAPGKVIVFDYNGHKAIRNLPRLKEPNSKGEMVSVYRHVETNDLAIVDDGDDTRPSNMIAGRYEEYKRKVATGYFTSTPWGVYERRQTFLKWSTLDDMTLEFIVETIHGKQSQILRFKRR